MKRGISVAAHAALFACSVVNGGEVENQTSKAMKALRDKVVETEVVVRNVLGEPFAEQAAKAIDELRRNPRSFKQQMKVVGILLTHTESLLGSATKAKSANLGSLRDQVTNGLDALATAQAEQRQRLLDRAKECPDATWRQRYEELASAATKLNQAYALRAKQYRDVPVTAQIVQLQLAQEYLTSVKELLTALRDGISTFLAADEVLRELHQFSGTIEQLHSSLRTFSDVVLSGTLKGDELPGTKNGSEP